LGRREGTQEELEVEGKFLRRLFGHQRLLLLFEECTSSPAYIFSILGLSAGRSGEGRKKEGRRS